MVKHGQQHNRLCLFRLLKKGCHSIYQVYLIVQKSVFQKVWESSLFVITGWNFIKSYNNFIKLSVLWTYVV